MRDAHTDAFTAAGDEPRDVPVENHPLDAGAAGGEETVPEALDEGAATRWGEPEDGVPGAGCPGQVDPAGETAGAGGGCPSPRFPGATDVGDVDETDNGVGAPGGWPPGRRLTNYGVRLLLVASLLYLAADAVPPAWIDRFTEVTGVDEILARVAAFRTDTPAGSEDISSPLMPAPSGEAFAGSVAPAAESGMEEAGERALQAEPVVTRPDLPTSPAPTFVVNFSYESDLLESDGWHALDNAALLLREQPERIALITDSTRGPEVQQRDPGLSGARIAAVEQYLLAAGIDRQRLWVGGRTKPEGKSGPDLSGVEATGTDDRFVYIFIVGSMSP